MFHVVTRTGSTAGYAKTFEQAKLIAIRTRKAKNLPYNSVSIVRLGTPKRVKKRFSATPQLHYYRTSKGHLKEWDE